MYRRFTKADTGLSLQLVNYLTSYNIGMKGGINWSANKTRALYLP